MKSHTKFLASIALLYASSGSVHAQSVWSDGFKSNPAKNWTYVADTVMGGQSEGTVEFIQNEKSSFARLSGNVTTENNGGFIQVRNKLGARPVKGLSGIKINVRGNGETYYIHVRTNGTRLPWQYYQVSFVAGKDWSEVVLPFSEFAPSGGILSKTPKSEKIKSVGIVAYGRDHTALLDVDSIGFY